MASEQELLNEAGEIVVEAISRMRAAHVACLDLTTHAEAFLRALNTRPAPADLKARDGKRYKLIRKSLQNKGLLPAATDTGLKTVAKLGGIHGVTLLHHIQYMTPKAQAEYKDELVKRSQAEELLAAAHDEKMFHVNDAVKAWNEVSKLETRVDALEADNAAKNARIKELEADLMCAKASRDSWKRTHEESFSRLETKLAAAEKALETKSAANEALSKSVVESIDTEKRLREALEPFSKFAGAVFEHNFNNTDVIFEISASDGGVLELKGKDFFEARAVLGGKPEGRKSEN
ncbi:hypothetical protein [Brucella anthropi]|uniref:hypothetical protein n=1 Tax=Brucella anthropi TaxID=529 RepID=UPI0021665E68|nr:hypothetical protein [Brucella anthropi]UVV66738.1 hypothetical protein NW321_09640 [Brucella anthropi]